MVVNSLNFLLFFLVVFVVYYLPVSRKIPKFQNTWLFLTSYIFYGVADWKMIPVLFGATVVYYGIGLWLKAEMKKGNVRTASNITTLGVVLGVCFLLYFKYLNFFAESFLQLLNGIGLYVSKRIAESLGGDIFMKSWESENITEVTLIIPIN